MNITLNIPNEVKISEEILVGDVEKFMELFEKGFYAEQWERLRTAAIAGIHSGLSETIQGSTIHIEATDLTNCINVFSDGLFLDDDSV